MFLLYDIDISEMLTITLFFSPLLMYDNISYTNLFPRSFFPLFFPSLFHLVTQSDLNILIAWYNCLRNWYKKETNYEKRVSCTVQYFRFSIKRLESYFFHTKVFLGWKNEKSGNEKRLSNVNKIGLDIEKMETCLQIIWQMSRKSHRHWLKNTKDLRFYLWTLQYWILTIESKFIAVKVA